MNNQSVLEWCLHRIVWLLHLTETLLQQIRGIELSQTKDLIYATQSGKSLGPTSRRADTNCVRARSQRRIKVSTPGCELPKNTTSDEQASAAGWVLQLTYLLLPAINISVSSDQGKVEFRKKDLTSRQ